MSRFLASPAGRFGLVGAVVVLFAAVGAVLLFAGGTQTAPRSFNLQVVGTQMTPDSLQANYSDPLTVSIVADKPEEIHLHGYDKHFFTQPGQAVTLHFPADKTGQFVIEIEATSVPLGTLTVRATGGLFGIGQPPDQSNTTVIKSSIPAQIQVGATPTYNLSLEVGGLQPMYTPQQVASQHPKSGEIMFTGDMQMPAGTTDATSTTYPPGWRHLEVHVFDKSGDVVKTVTPHITVTNTATNQSQTVPIVTMQGIADGIHDFHYGNNVLMPSGPYTVSVQVGTDSASFNLTVS